MKKRLYPRLAWQGIRKNGKIYFPYLAACIFVVMVYYLIGFLSSDPVIREMEGGAQMQIILSLGTGVMGIFSVIFLFYTNSFLMKRRKKELGLYQYDEKSIKKGVEVPVKENDHCCDGSRYLCMGMWNLIKYMLPPIERGDTD